MKNLIALLLAFLCLAWGQENLAESRIITLVADEWPPFNGKPCSQKEGYLVDVARAVFEEQGYQVVYQLVPWARAINMTRLGQADGAIGASRTDAPDFIFPEEELARNKLAFYTRKGDPWRFAGPSSVEGVTLGTIAGYDYRPWLLDYIAANQDNARKVQILHGNEPLQRNITKLLAGRIDVVVDNEAAILSVASELGVLEQISCAGYGDETSFIYIAFSPAKPESPAVAALLPRGIAAMREDGRLRAILARYNLSDWQ